MATIRDVARESGVSVATVSYVLNNGPRPVRDETRERVLAVMRRLDYHPNAMARGLVRRRLFTLGVLFSSVEPTVVTNNYATCVLRGIMAAAVQAGYNVTIFTRPWQDARRSAARFGDRRTDGILVAAPSVGSDVVSGLAQRGVPVVVVSAPSNDSCVPWVDVDNARGAVLATEHLLALGHRRIAFLMGDGTQRSVFQRRDAFMATLGRAGVPVRDDYWLPGSFEPEVVYRNVTRLLNLPEPPTSIFTTNDDMAATTLEAARDLGVRVPQDLSVIGFDDYPYKGVGAPILTTVRHPLAEVGEAAARLLIDRVEGRGDGQREMVFQPELIVRETTLPPSSRLN